ncbi:Ankyrin repeat-containing domain [Trinorchestia longiramus]|nr:Ankyrin repeat-containing domain [Trinorchestia longiramus]
MVLNLMSVAFKVKRASEMAGSGGKFQTSSASAEAEATADAPTTGRQQAQSAILRAHAGGIAHLYAVPTTCSPARQLDAHRFEVGSSCGLLATSCWSNSGIVLQLILVPPLEFVYFGHVPFYYYDRKVMDSSHPAQCSHLTWTVSAQYQAASFSPTHFPLHEAVEEDDWKAVKILLRSGRDVNENEFCGATPLHMACMTGNYDMAVYLIQQGAMVDAPNFERNTPLCYAAVGCHPRLVKLMLSLGAQVNPPLLLSTPLHEACIRSGAGKKQQEACEVVELLLEHQADVSCNDGHYGTPLHTACSRPSPDVRVIEHLLISGANPNCLQNHRTPLHLIAQFSKNYECAYILICYGADIELRNNKNQLPADLVNSGTPLHALLTMKGHQPHSLCLIARIAARKAIGMERLKHLDDLPIPFGLKIFLRSPCPVVARNSESYFGCSAT